MIFKKIKPARSSGIATDFRIAIFQLTLLSDSRWKRVKHGRLYERKLELELGRAGGGTHGMNLPVVVF